MPTFSTILAAALVGSAYASPLDLPSQIQSDWNIILSAFEGQTGSGSSTAAPTILSSGISLTNSAAPTVSTSLTSGEIVSSTVVSASRSFPSTFWNGTLASKTSSRSIVSTASTNIPLTTTFSTATVPTTSNSLPATASWGTVGYADPFSKQGTSAKCISTVLDKNDTLDAVAALGPELGYPIEPDQIISGVGHDAVAFVCNYDSVNQTIKNTEAVLYAAALILDTCKAGEAHTAGWLIDSTENLVIGVTKLENGGFPTTVDKFPCLDMSSLPKVEQSNWQNVPSVSGHIATPIAPMSIAGGSAAAVTSAPGHN